MNEKEIQITFRKKSNSNQEAQSNFRNRNSRSNSSLKNVEIMKVLVDFADKTQFTTVLQI